MAGFTVVGESSWRSLVHDVHRWSPTVILGWADTGDADVFTATALLESTRPTAVLVFTPDVGVERMTQALRCGVHAYVINGYGAQRLRSLVQLSLARFERDEGQRRAWDDLSRRFEERKLVDRAKGILMRAQQMSEDEAFRLLRQASQQGNRRVGVVSQHIIATAQDAEWVNLAGRLRMLSQRQVKFMALLAGGPDVLGAHELLRQSVGQVDDILQRLGHGLSVPTLGDLLKAITTAWKPLRQAIQSGSPPDGLMAVDALADDFLARADQLTAQLEFNSLAPRLHMINLAGRQRMHSQRLAKQALLAGLQGIGAAQTALRDAAAQTMLAYEQAAADLRRLPLSSPDLIVMLDTAEADWQELLAGAQQASSVAGRARVGHASEALLQRLEHITAQYERSMQLLMG